MSVIQKHKYLKDLDLSLSKFTEEQTEMLFKTITTFDIFNSLTTLKLFEATNFSSD